MEIRIVPVPVTAFAACSCGDDENQRCLRRGMFYVVIDGTWDNNATCGEPACVAYVIQHFGEVVAPAEVDVIDHPIHPLDYSGPHET